MNRVTITGNLTRDAHMNGPALNIGVAVNERFKNKQTGQWEDRANFIDCTMFGSRAEKVKPYLTKGTKVAVEGKLHWSQWDDKATGKKRSKVEVYVDDIEFMGTRPQQQQQAQQTFQPYGAPQPPAQPQVPVQQPFDGNAAVQPMVDTSDIPF